MKEKLQGSGSLLRRFLVVMTPITSSDEGVTPPSSFDTEETVRWRGFRLVTPSHQSGGGDREVPDGVNVRQRNGDCKGRTRREYTSDSFRRIILGPGPPCLVNFPLPERPLRSGPTAFEITQT